jgi:flagellar biosynthesis/type III secretory pathway protein FliH
MAHITLFEELALKEGLEKGIQKGLVEGRQKGRQEGRQKGLVEGRQEGRQEGLVQNAREAVLEVLDTRFGQVPDSVREQVNTLCSEPTLKELLRRSARVSSLDEFSVSL